MKIKCSWRQLWHWWFREVSLDKFQAEKGDWMIGEDDQFLKQLREMEGRAYKGPWIIQTYPRHGRGMLYDQCVAHEETDRTIITNCIPKKAEYEWDAELICALRNNILPLLDEIERLQAENERLKKEIDFAYKPL